MTVATALQTIIVELPGLFAADGRYYEFAGPVRLEIDQEESGVWVYKLPALEFFGFGLTRGEAMEMVKGMLSGAYETYALAEDSDLNSDAQEYKRSLLNLITRVL